MGYAVGERFVQLLTVPDLRVERGSRVALVGSNGVGKTTLLETFLGLVPPVSGSVSLGHNVEVGFQRQAGDGLPEESSVLDALLDARNVGIGEARDYLARFLFQGEDVFQPVASLSGGERTRLALARLVITEPNVLVLDEPTTHLDIPSREALEQALLAYDGTLLFVSHDRHLISLLANQLWIVEDGDLSMFEGPFEEWVRRTEETSGSPATPTKRRRRSARRRAPAPKKEPPQVPRPDPEEVISGLESRLADIERELEVASERQDVAEIVRLGEEYNETQARLAQALEDWGG